MPPVQAERKVPAHGTPSEAGVVGNSRVLTNAAANRAASGRVQGKRVAP